MKTQVDIPFLVKTVLKTAEAVPKDKTRQVVHTINNQIIISYSVNFTGDPCAESALVGAACAQGYFPTDMRCIVAVFKTRRTGEPLLKIDSLCWISTRISRS